MIAFIFTFVFVVTVCLLYAEAYFSYYYLYKIYALFYNYPTWFPIRSPYMLMKTTDNYKIFGGVLFFIIMRKRLLLTAATILLVYYGRINKLIFLVIYWTSLFLLFVVLALNVYFYWNYLNLALSPQVWIPFVFSSLLGFYCFVNLVCCFTYELSEIREYYFSLDD